MSAVTTDTAVTDKVQSASDRRARITGGVLIGFGLFVIAVLGVDATEVATFKLNYRGVGLSVPDLVVPGWVNQAIAVLLALLGGRLFLRGGGRRTSLFTGIALALLVAAFLVWATAGHSFSLTGMLKASIFAAVPIALGGLAGVLSERVAVVNIAIEGMLLAGAFAGALMGSLLGSWLGLGAAVMVGGMFGLMLSALVVTFRMDQIIAGVVINLLVLGLTSYVTSQVFAEHRWMNNAETFKAFKIPLLGDIPVVGAVLFNQNLFVYGAFILVGLATYYLFYTKGGLRARAVGEHPRAADTLGIDVYWTRYFHVTLAGMVAGFGGAWFTLGATGRFDENMTNGKGFIGLAAMIFGRWHPVGALAAALIFGFASSLEEKLALLNTPIPSEFLAMAPYIATIIVVAGLIGKARPPAADGQPYVKE